MAPSADVRHRGSADARVVTGAALIIIIFPRDVHSMCSQEFHFTKPRAAARGAIEPIVSPHTMYNGMYLSVYSRIRTGPDTPYTGVASKAPKVAGFRYARSVRL